MSDANGLPPGSRPCASRRLKIALGVSLALNLLVTGLIGGAFLARDGGRDGAPALRILGLAPVAAALPRDARAEMRRRLAADAPALRRERAEIGRGIGEVRRALLIDPFEGAAVEQALARSRAAAAALQARGHAALLATLEEMSPQERALVAERMEDVLRRMPGRAR